MYKPADINFLMNPKTEDLLKGGNRLQEGMIVLLENPIMRLERRNEKGEFDSPHAERRWLETARWCMVSELSRRDDLVSFIGVYEDGTKMSRTYNKSYSWYYKIDPNGVPVINPEGWGKCAAKSDTENTEFIPRCSFLIGYDMVGDLEGMEWAYGVLSSALRDGKIINYSVLTSLRGAWGIQHVVFQFDADFPSIDPATMNLDDILTIGQDFANELVGDSDCEAYAVEVTNVK